MKKGRAQGISPTGAAIISLAVGWAVGPAGLMKEGVGANLLASAQGVEVSALNGTMAAMANAGFSSLVTQAATALVGNGGDIGAALKQLGSSDTLKALATSMVTAGLIQGLGVEDALSSKPAAGASPAAVKMTEFTNSLKVAMAKGTIGAVVDSAINGNPLGDNMKNVMLSAATQVAHGAITTEIGVAFENAQGFEKAGQYIAHAVTGCAIGAASGGDCGSGAGGAVVAEFVATAYLEQIKSNHNAGLMTDAEYAEAIQDAPGQATRLAALAAATTVGLAGGDAATAGETGQTVAENNAVRVWVTAAKVVAKLGAKVIKKGKISWDDIKSIGKDEIVDLIDAGATLVDPNASVEDKILAGLELAIGIKINAKDIGKMKEYAQEAQGIVLKSDAHKLAKLDNYLPGNIKQMSEANITNTGETVLGHRGYVEKAKSRGASYFDIGETWDSLSKPQRWAANRNFLDKIAASRDKIILSVEKTKIREDSILKQEIDYLTEKKGYVWVNQWSLKPR